MKEMIITKMGRVWRRAGVLAMLTALAVAGCGRESATAAKKDGADAKVTTLGSIEVTARLVEIPQGAIFKRELYDYAAILKYQVVQVHRGKVHADTIYVGQYNPTKPRSEAADRRVKVIGGTVTSFQVGQVHRLALDVPIDDYFMGGIVNKYFEQETGPLYWAVWTNQVGQ